MRSFINRMLATVLATFTFMQGCTAMSNDDVLKFSTHDLGILCYGGVTKVWLEYAGSDHALYNDGEAARDKTAADANRVPSFASGSYSAFAGPVQSRWTARDGSTLSHTIALDAIFKDRTIRHGVDPKRINRDKPFFGGEPTIIVEFDDRTVSVYISASLLLKGETGLEGTDVYYRAYSHTL